MQCTEENNKDENSSYTSVPLQPRIRSKQTKTQMERRMEMPTSSIRPFFSSVLLDNITLTLQVLKKYNDIIKDDRDNNEGVLH